MELLAIPFVIKVTLTVLGLLALCYCVAAFVVLWHELGHYLAARLSDVKVGKIIVGWGPKLRLGKLQLGLIPSSGRCEIPELASIPAKKRIFLAAAGPFASVLLALLIWPINDAIAKFTLTVGLFNLLPVFNLDGHVIVKAIKELKASPITN